MTRTPNLYGNPRPSPRVLRTSVQQEIIGAQPPQYGDIENARLAKPDDPEYIAAREALRQKFVDAGVIPDVAPLANTVQPTNETENES